MGVPPEAASSYLLPRRMGWQRAARMLLGAEWLTADEAVSAGLATAVCPAEELLGTSMAAAQTIAAHDRSATRRIKSLMRAGEREEVRVATARERDAFARLFGRFPAD
jgi:enoyl-CoA hydratase/carnithine racemase